MTASPYAIVDLARVSAAMQDETDYAPVANADYAPGKFRCNRHVFKPTNRLALVPSLTSVVFV